MSIESNKIKPLCLPNIRNILHHLGIERQIENYFLNLLQVFEGSVEGEAKPADRETDEAFESSCNDIFCLLSLLPVGKSSSCPPGGEAVI